MSLELRKAREEAGYTVEEVAERLNIRKQYIIYLEEGNFDAIPGKVYANGYMKMYKKLLKLDEYSTFPVKINQNKAVILNTSNDKLKTKYIVFVSSIMLVLSVLLYATMKSSKVSLTENKLIKNMQEPDGNN
jgi:cytoskeletal protein RodZ